jgi:integrase
MSWSGSAGAIARGSTAFIEDLKNRLTTALGTLARGTAGVEIRERRGEPWITVPPIGKLAEPENLRHFLFTWLKAQGVDDALIQPYSGHETRTSLEIYSRLAITDAQRECDAVIDRFPV